MRILYNTSNERDFQRFMEDFFRAHPDLYMVTEPGASIHGWTRRLLSQRTREATTFEMNFDGYEFTLVDQSLEEPIPQEPKVLTREELDANYMASAEDYFNATMALCTGDEALTELNYIRNTIKTPKGGTYLLSIIHVEGPKIDLVELRKKMKGQV